MVIKETRQAASFATAPQEILLQIAKAVPDLPSLYHLALASPSIFRLWESYGPELIRKFTSNRAVITPQVRDLIWLIALLRTGTMPIWSFDTFLEHFIKPTVSSNGPPELPCMIPEPEACPFSVLVTASRIYHLTLSCIEYYLEKLRAVQPRLRRPVDPNFSYADTHGPYELMVPGWLRHTECVFYETPQMGPASWIEQQRVFRAFWRLQLLYDFRRAAKESQMRGWSREDVDSITHLQLEALYPPVPPFPASWVVMSLQEILGVQDYLEDYNEGSFRPTNETLGGAKVGLSEIPEDAWSWVVPEKILWPNSTRRRIYPERIVQHTYAPCGPTRELNTWNLLSGLIRDDQSPIKGVSISVYRRLGFAIWDEQRLLALELYGIRVGREGRMLRKSHSDFWFQWRSMLSEEELAEVVGRLSDATIEEERDPDWWIGPPDESDTPHNKYKVRYWEYILTGQ